MNDSIMSPGPIPFIPKGLEGQSKQIIRHRERAFSNLLTKVTGNLQKVFIIENDLF